jgi:hypothetical protein
MMTFSSERNIMGFDPFGENDALTDHWIVCHFIKLVSSKIFCDIEAFYNEWMSFTNSMKT